MGRRGRRGPGRVRRREHLLGSARGPLGQPAIAGPPALHWARRRRRHDRHRAGQPGAQRRAAQGLRPPRVGQDPPRPGGRRGEQHRAGRRGRPRDRRARQRLRVFPGAVRPRRGTQRRRVLHPPQRRAAASRDAPALPRPRLRPLLRLGRHVRAVRGVHPRPRQRQRQRAPDSGPESARLRATSPSTARSRTTPPGEWRR